MAPVSEVIRIEGVTRVHRTFSFVDVSGFTTFTDREGDAAAVELLGRTRGNIRALASVYGVRIAKWLGDGAMLVGVDPEPVIEAVVCMVESEDESDQRLRLRAGVASGDVILFEGDDHIGQAVNLASRLSDLAGPGEVLAPATIQTSLLVNATARSHGRHAVPGIESPIELVRFTSTGR